MRMDVVVRRKPRCARVVAACAALAFFLSAEIAPAQLAAVDPETGLRTEASAATTIMLDASYLAQVLGPDEVYPVPIDGPAGGEKISHPGILRSFAVARVGLGGRTVTRCFAPGELEVPVAEYLGSAGDQR